MQIHSSSTNDLQETDIQREVQRRRKEYWEREFGPDSELAKKLEDAIWGTPILVIGPKSLDGCYIGLAEEEPEE